MEYAFVIEVFPKLRSLFGIEMKTSEYTIEVQGEQQDRYGHTFTIGLAIIHIQFTVFRKY